MEKKKSLCVILGGIEQYLLLSSAEYYDTPQSIDNKSDLLRCRCCSYVAYNINDFKTHVTTIEHENDRKLNIDYHKKQLIKMIDEYNNFKY